ncbi:Sister chromatid cohesion protein pds5 [Coemansia sp. RSA 1813]|nr:Sister chromatid cohesion protein pds5 [Coemansia sp. RSA 1646]KAJ1773228.1 Sister chromatid cohesion protein pds5 [Coemansia sp. RSA 1843]KAJ2092696.1 Sister chromatid cohesion protein pds5 [Coemansia sp. RSA 986]KAJ2217807.1 Sister chromatid cohesion protein pds5 [Coemansia sp. RSA 487]KAJ2572958.1 Sister chromatid cohesion protein pds5 [Coemansia sp. RSA 1813]
MTQDNEAQELSFQPKLFTNATQKKAVTISELYKQLKKLSKELNSLEQETVDTQTLDAVTRQLLAPALLKHKEAGVVSYVTCCIADILRLYAPEAPYSDSEIKTIFNVFIDQLQLLGDHNNQFFPLREYLLTSLATVRTPALVAMLPDSEQIVSRFFTVLFGVVSPDQPHNIQMQILDVLQQLLEEPKTVAQDVIDVILLQFTRKRQQDNPTAHQLASDLANATADILQKYIYQYFNDVIVSASQLRADQMRNEGEAAAGQRRERAASMSNSLDDLRSAHYLILELNKSAPGTLLNVIPQLEEEMCVEDVDIRVLATGVLGEMFAEKGFTLAKRYETTWKTWKGRRADASPLVRVQWIEHAVSLYQHQPQLSRELNDFVVEKLSDVDEKVRQAACHSLGILEMSQSVQGAISESVVEALSERCKDRRSHVRSEAIISLAAMYSQVYEELEGGNVAARNKWGGIPSKIFVLRYINDPDIDSKVESILTGAILNFTKIKDDRSRCQRLLFVFSSLTTKARNGFFSYMQRQRDAIRLTDMYLELCGKQCSSATEESGSAIDQQIRLIIVKISTLFPEKSKVESALTQLAGLHDAEVYKGLRQTMDPNNDVKAVRKHQKSSLKRLSSLAPSLLETTAPIWKCVGLTTINRGLVPYLIEYMSSRFSSSSNAAQIASAAETILSYITNVFPEMLCSSSDALFDTAELGLDDVVTTEERLALMVRYAKAIPKSVPKSAELESQLASFVRAGSLRQAKYSAYLLTQMEGTESQCSILTGDMVDNLDNRHLERRSPSFAALSRFARYAPSAFSMYAERVSQYLVQSVLLDPLSDADMDDEPKDDEGMDTSDDSEWVPRESLDESGLVKVHAVKILTNWLAGMERQMLTRDNVQTVLGTLRQLVRNAGEMQQDRKTRTVHRNHLLLTAGSCMMKLASFAHFEKMLNTADMLAFSMLVQASCYEVRSSFLLKKLVPALVARRIHVRYIPAIFLVAYDVEPTLRDNIKHVVEQRLSQFRPTPGSPSVVEDSLCRFLYILAHHPDWDDSQPVATLELFAPYIEFYIGCVCMSQNVSLLFCYAGEIKTYQNRPVVDGINKQISNEVFTRRLYVLSELAQYLLREKSISSNWPVNVYPGKLALPTDIFEPLSDTDKVSVPRDPFLSPEFISRRAKTPAAARANANKRTRPKIAVSAAAAPTGEVADKSKIKRQRSLSGSRTRAKGKEPAPMDDESDVEDVEMSSVAETSDEE